MESVLVDLPGCKSSSQRAVLLAALARGTSCLRGLGDGDDTRFLRDALAALGVSFDDQADGSTTVVGQAGPPAVLCEELQIGEGGSTLRFLLPLLATQDCSIRFQVATGLMARPHAALLDVLQSNGCKIETHSDGFHIHGVAQSLPMPSTVPVGLSSQFFSGLLMTSGRTAQSWVLDGVPVSQGYLDMTVSMLRQFRGTDCVAIDGQQWQQKAGFGTAQEVQIPADASAALFFAVAAILIQRTITFTAPTSVDHPDAYALRFLEHTVFDSAVAAPIFDLALSPDSGPALAVLAASQPVGIRFINAERLRHKESDRIDGMARLAQACGGELNRDGELLWIHALGTAPTHTAFDPAFDHRLAMAAGVAALRWPGIEVTDPGVVAKSFPDFWHQLDLLR